MPTKTCISCNKNYNELLQAKVAWKEHEGLVLLELCKEPEYLNPRPNASMCAVCSIKTISGLLQLEIGELSDTITNMGDLM